MCRPRARKMDSVPRPGVKSRAGDLCHRSSLSKGRQAYANVIFPSVIAGVASRRVSELSRAFAGLEISAFAMVRAIKNTDRRSSIKHHSRSQAASDDNMSTQTHSLTTNTIMSGMIIPCERLYQLRCRIPRTAGSTGRTPRSPGLRLFWKMRTRRGRPKILDELSTGHGKPRPKPRVPTRITLMKTRPTLAVLVSKVFRGANPIAGRREATRRVQS